MHPQRARLGDRVAALLDQACLVALGGQGPEQVEEDLPAGRLRLVVEAAQERGRGRLEAALRHVAVEPAEAEPRRLEVPVPVVAQPVGEEVGARAPRQARRGGLRDRCGSGPRSGPCGSGGSCRGSSRRRACRTGRCRRRTAATPGRQARWRSRGWAQPRCRVRCSSMVDGVRRGDPDPRSGRSAVDAQFRW